MAIRRCRVRWRLLHVRLRNHWFHLYLRLRLRVLGPLLWCRRRGVGRWVQASLIVLIIAGIMIGLPVTAIIVVLRHRVESRA